MDINLKQTWNKNELILTDKQCLYVFNYHIPELPKEVANLFLEAANTEEEKIALGRIYWKLLGIQKGMNS